MAEGTGMSEAVRGFGHESDVLIRHLDGHLAALRSAGSPDLRLAEQVAGVLRSLVTDTTFASAADRARVRAAVHYFLLRRGGRGHRRLVRAVSEDVRVVNEIAHGLGRDDLLIAVDEPLVPA
jgi:hypothetical protein